MVRVTGGRAAALGLAACLLLASSCSRGPAAAPADTPTSTSAALSSLGTVGPGATTAPTSGGPAGGDTGAPTGPTPAPAQWQPCDQLQCATVAVPLDHAHPEGPSIRIALIRRPATGTRRGAVFVNPGGPGGSGVDYVRRNFELDATTMASYDLIGFDPRGVGASTPVHCDLKRAASVQPDYSPDSPAEVAALDDEARTFAQACAATDATLLPHLRTEQVAQDLDWLRQAVGDAKLNYVGFSFGTLIGLLYAQQFPDRVDHMVLDGVVDPTQSLTELLFGQAEAFEHAFGVLDAACGSGLSCPPGGAAAARDQLMARLEQSGPMGPLGPAELDDATVIALYDRSLWPVYTSALSAGLNGQPAQLKRLSDVYATTVPFGAYAGVECTDGPRPADPAAWDRFAAETIARAPRFGAAVANELRTCAWWPVAPGPARDPVTARGAPPILVIGNTNDPATPLANAQSVADHLAQARLVVAAVDGHTAYSSNPCVRQAVQHYFTDGSLPAVGARC